MITAITRMSVVVAVLAVPLTAIAQLNVVSRNSELKFDGTNFGNTDQVATETGLSGPFDAAFGETLLQGTPNGRDNYYGTAMLYIVGQGLVPWEARGVFGDFSTELEDSYPIAEEGLLGGGGQFIGRNRRRRASQSNA